MSTILIHAHILHYDTAERLRQAKKVRELFNLTLKQAADICNAEGLVIDIDGQALTTLHHEFGVNLQIRAWTAAKVRVPA